ncbi:exported protein of unknown function [Blastococcus saxobsidens DD2]|uniref:Uncharacterized protein n=1 Tax=Blastococcus saxobsidens (strain DD2) TaxID=1146883 RepID=H6RUJ2_BLASD|nr:exported protein of unknown function [Blastococcus saxobsidens DD2]
MRAARPGAAPSPAGMGAVIGLSSTGTSGAGDGPERFRARPSGHIGRAADPRLRRAADPRRPGTPGGRGLRPVTRP